MLDSRHLADRKEKGGLKKRSRRDEKKPASKELLPRLALIWGDSHYGGTFLLWAKLTLGWVIQTIKAFTIPKRGLLVPEGEEVDWDQLFPKGFRPQRRQMGSGAHLRLDSALASPLSRS